MTLTLFSQKGLLTLAQVLTIDVMLAGDNAVVIGLAAARLPPNLRRRIILAGLIAAVILRLGLALVAMRLMEIIGLTLAGGILLLWVSWRLWREVSKPPPPPAGPKAKASTGRAVLGIVLADVSMSLDNVLGVAGAARQHLDILVIGLLLSVAFMGAAAEMIARLLERFRWISYLGLAVVIYVALSMIWAGSHDVAQALRRV
ncbi:MAG: YjbE family putative metal transport protein [Rhizomicrobium sp.]